MKRCPNCAHNVDDVAILCPNCGSPVATSEAGASTPRREISDLIGCIPVAVSLLDVFLMPFALLGLWGAGQLGLTPRPPLWGTIAYFAFQIGVLALLIYFYKRMLRRAVGPRARSLLLITTTYGAVFLGLGTACNAWLIIGSR